MPNEGVFSLKKITTEKAISYFRKMADNFSGYMELYTSAIGHQSTCDALNTLLELQGSEKITVNRIEIQMKRGDEALIFKPKGRLEEGKVLTVEELNQIGYDFYHLFMMATNESDLEEDACMAGAASITGSIWQSKL